MEGSVARLPSLLSSEQQSPLQQQGGRIPIDVAVAAPKINNVKTHIYLTRKGRKRLLVQIGRYKIKMEKHNNFSVCRDPELERRAYTLFEKQGFINITGIPNLEAVADVIPRLCTVFHLRASHVASSQPCIDNISAAGVFPRRLDLNRLRRILLPEVKSKAQSARGVNEVIDPNPPPSSYFTILLNRDKFPGASCRAKGYGTITLFSSGKYVIVGSKCLEQMQQVFLKMAAVIATL